MRAEVSARASLKVVHRGIRPQGPPRPLVRVESIPLLRREWLRQAVMPIAAASKEWFRTHQLVVSVRQVRGRAMGYSSGVDASPAMGSQ